MTFAQFNFITYIVEILVNFEKLCPVRISASLLTENFLCTLFLNPYSEYLWRKFCILLY